MVRVDRIVLHIGTEKTGTSSIQHFLSKNRAALATDGVVYPQYSGLNGGSQWGFVAAVVKRPWQADFGARLGIRDEVSAGAYRKQLIAAIDKELLACPERQTLLVSCEHFHSRLRKPARLRALKGLLARWSDSVEVVVYLRRQDRVATSHYSTLLKSGQPSPRVFPPLVGGLPYYYNYERLYDNWTQVFGEQAVQVGLYEHPGSENGDLVTDFCSRVGIDETGKKRFARVNRSLSETGVQIMLELNKQWPKERLSDPDPSRELLVASIGREHPGRCFPATRAEAQAFYAHFVDSNTRLAERAFPALGVELFAQDFSDYPEVLVPRSADVSDEVRSRIKAWKAVSKAEQKAGLGRRLLSVRHLLGGVPSRLKTLLRSGKRPVAVVPPIPTIDLPPVFLHMGLPKTATTTLQNSLFSQHPGICYLGKQGDWKSVKHCSSDGLYYALRPIFWDQKETTQPELVRSVLHAHSEEGGPEKPILGSWEGLIIKPHRAFKKMLREVQGTVGDVRVLITLRNPLKRLPSAYLHTLKSCAKHGRHHTMPAGRAFIPFDDWLAGSHRGAVNHDYRFDFGDNLRFAVEFLGRDKVGVFLLEDMIENRLSFFADLLRFMGIDGDEVGQIDDKHLNLALSTAQVEFLKAIDASDDKREQWLALPREERRLRMSEIAETGAQNKYTLVLTDAQQRLIEDKSRDLNRWLVETFGLDLERHQYPL